MGNKVLKSGIWYTISNFALKGMEFLTIPLFTRLMSQGEYGLYNNYFSWLQIALVIGTMYLYPSLYSARFDYKETIHEYITTILLLGSAFAGVELVATQILSKWVVPFLGVENKYIIIMFIYAMLRPALEIYMISERFQYNYKRSVQISIVSNVVSLGASIVLLFTMQNKLDARVFGTYIPLIVVCAVLYLGYLKKKICFVPEYAKYALIVGWPYVPHALAMTMLSSTDRIMITRYCSNEDTALYSLAYTCALAVTVLWGSINTAFAPWLGEHIHNKDYESIHKVSLKYSLIVAVPVVGLMLMAPDILLVLGGEKYYSAKNVIAPIMTGCYIQFIYSMYVNIEQFVKKTVGMAFASIMAAIINFVLNLIFIPRYGYIAAAYTTLVGYLFLLIFHYFLVRRMKLHKVYNTVQIGVVVSIMIALSFTVIMLYAFPIVRYSLFLIYLVMLGFLLLRNKKEIVNILK